MPGIQPVHLHVYRRAYVVAGVPLRTQFVHELGIAHAHRLSVDHSAHAAPGQLLHRADAALVDVLTVGLADGAGDGMVGIALRIRRQLQKFRLGDLVGMDGGDVEHALGQRARLVKDDDLRLRERFQIAAALDEYAVARGSADAAEEAQRHGDDQRAGAGDHQEDQRPRPLTPIAADERGHHRQQHRGNDHAGRVHAGELGDEVLRARLLAAGVLHQIENFGNGRFAKRLRHPHAQKPALVDAAADDVVALAHVAGQALARQRRGVQRRAPFQHHAVQRHALAGFDHDDVAHGYLIGIDLLRFAVALEVGVVRPYLHQLGDGLPRAPHRVGLEQFAHLIKQHHEHGLGVFAGGKRAHRGQRHEEVFVKHLPVGDVAHGLPQNVPTDDGVGDEEGKQPPYPLKRRERAGDEQRRADKYPSKHLPVFPAHGSVLLLPGMPPGRFP